MKNIFEKLEKKGIPYSVARVRDSVTGATHICAGWDYFIIVTYKDAKGLKGFLRSKSEFYVKEHTMTPEEINIFKRNIDKYVKKFDNVENGEVIWELKGSPFQSHYNKTAEDIARIQKELESYGVYYYQSN